MFLYEHEELARKQGREEGFKEGQDKIIISQIQKKLAKNKSADQIADELELDPEEVDLYIKKNMHFRNVRRTTDETVSRSHCINLSSKNAHVNHGRGLREHLICCWKM